MGLFSNPAGTALIINDAGDAVVDCTDCPCDGGPCSMCDGGGPEEYTLQFEGTLTNEDCADCDSCFVGVQFVLTFDTGAPCDNLTQCCWQYNPACCSGPTIILIVEDNLVTLTIVVGVIEAQWVWDRGASTTCAASSINANLAYDVGDEFLCSGWSTLSWTIT